MKTRVNMQETGIRIYNLMADKNITAKDVAKECGLAVVQGVYKWWWGKSLPSLDNFVILADMLGTTIDEILVVERGDIESG